MECRDWNDREKRAVGEIRSCFSRIGLCYALFLGVSTLTQWLAILFLTYTGLEERLDDSLYLLISILSMYPVAVPLAAWLMKRVPAKGKAGQERWGFGKLAGFFVFSMGILEAGNLVGVALMALASVLKGEVIANSLDELILSMEPWAVLVTAVIAAPVVEELVFRKWLLDRIAGYGHWTAMLVSGVVFGIAHGNFYQFFYAFGLGVIFAYMYLHTGKIRYPIGFHMLINLIGSMAPMGLLNVLESHALIGAMMVLCNLMLMAGFLVCAVVLALCCRQELTFRPAMDGLTFGKRMRAVWCNAGMCLFFLCGAVLFVLSL